MLSKNGRRRLSEVGTGAMTQDYRNIEMNYTTLGKTGVRVSVAGLGTGGFSRLGLKAGKTEEEAARLIHEAVEIGRAHV